MELEYKTRLVSFLSERGQALEFSELTPDASTREYFRVSWNGSPAIACVYPSETAGRDQFDACLDVTDVFLTAGLPVAKILDSDSEQLIIVHDDFGDLILRDALATDTEAARDLHLDAAIRLIARIQQATSIAQEKNSISARLMFDVAKLTWELNFFRTHYFETLKTRPLSLADSALLDAEFAELAKELEDRAKVLTHRDYHAANLMIQDGELKIIDHQDARIGTMSYDLVSLLLDRVTTLPTPEWLASKRRLLIDERLRLGLEDTDDDEFTNEFRLQTIQRCLKAIGTFSFQSANRGKTHFLPFIKPMFGIVLRAAENLQRFPVLQRLIKEEL